MLGQFGKVIEGRWIEDSGLKTGLHSANVCGFSTFLQPFPATYFDSRRDLPPLEGHTNIDGNTMRKIERPQHPAEDEEEGGEEDDSEDISAVVSELPLVLQVDPSKHFLKRGKS